MAWLGRSREVRRRPVRSGELRIARRGRFGGVRPGEERFGKVRSGKARQARIVFTEGQPSTVQGTGEQHDSHKNAKERNEAA